MAPSLPTNPSLEHFGGTPGFCSARCGQALPMAMPEALARVARHHPAGAPTEAAEFKLTAAQHVVAREVGFSGWPRLQAYLRTAEPLRRDPTAEPSGDPLSRFLALACLTYSPDDGPERWSKAADVLRGHPDLPARSLFAAAVLGDPADTAGRSGRDGPAAARRRGRPGCRLPVARSTHPVHGVDALLR